MNHKESQSHSISENSPQYDSKRKTDGFRPNLPFEVMIMAGGKGERLEPLTQDIPKPLLKIAGKPIVEYMVMRLKNAGVKHFTFCVNHLGHMIQRNFRDGSDWNVSIDYIFETKPLGTIGGTSLKEDFLYEDVLVVNGDLLTNINFEKFYLHYLENDADIAVASIPYRVSLPYGIFNLDEVQSVSSVEEKPTHTYHINSGIYFIKKSVFKLIDENQAMDAIDLIQIAIQKGLKVSSFPLLEYWIDIGRIEDYKKAQNDIDFIDL